MLIRYINLLTKQIESRNLVLLNQIIKENKDSTLINP